MVLRLRAKSAGWVWLFLYAYSLQIYFDFSGYTDMARGLARILGFRAIDVGATGGSLSPSRLPLRLRACISAMIPVRSH